MWQAQRNSHHQRSIILAKYSYRKKILKFQGYLTLILHNTLRCKGACHAVATAMPSECTVVCAQQYNLCGEGEILPFVRVELNSIAMAARLL